MITKISNVLKKSSPLDLSNQLNQFASVAIILHGNNQNLKVGFIQRAHDPNDRWSGQIAYPGGKNDPEDTSALATSVRETQEEIGLILAPHESIGRLDDIQARKQGTLLDFYIRPFVFHIDRDFEVKLDPSEVADFFWVPLKELQNSENKTHHLIYRDDKPIQLPAINVNKDVPLWGLTYLMTQNLLHSI